MTPSQVEELLCAVWMIASATAYRCDGMLYAVVSCLCFAISIQCFVCSIINITP